MHTAAAPDPLVLGPLFGVGRRLYSPPRSEAGCHLRNPDFAAALLRSADDYRYAETLAALIMALDPYVQAIADHDRRLAQRFKSRKR